MKKRKKSTVSDLKKLDKIADRDIDYSDSPALDDSFFTRATIDLPKKKESITLRVDHEVLEFFKGTGKGYQTLMNAVLRAYVMVKGPKIKHR